MKEKLRIRQEVFSENKTKFYPEYRFMFSWSAFADISVLSFGRRPPRLYFETYDEAIEYLRKYVRNSKARKTIIHKFWSDE